MATSKVKLNHAALGAKLKSGEVAAAVHAAAEEIAANARGAGVRIDGIPGKYELPVKVTDYTTDRACSAVTIAHPSGLAVQAKHGVLTGGAAGAGFEVSG